ACHKRGCLLVARDNCLDLVRVFERQHQVGSVLSSSSEALLHAHAFKRFHDCVINFHFVSTFTSGENHPASSLSTLPLIRLFDKSTAPIASTSAHCKGNINLVHTELRTSGYLSAGTREGGASLSHTLIVVCWGSRRVEAPSEESVGHHAAIRAE